jgi:hypothetical protein
MISRELPLMLALTLVSAASAWADSSSLIRCKDGKDKVVAEIVHDSKGASGKFFLEKGVADVWSLGIQVRPRTSEIVPRAYIYGIEGEDVQRVGSIFRNGGQLTRTITSKGALLLNLENPAESTLVINAKTSFWPYQGQLRDANEAYLYESFFKGAVDGYYNGPVSCQITQIR